MLRAVLSCWAGAYRHSSLWGFFMGLWGPPLRAPLRYSPPDQAHSQRSCCSALCDGPHSSRHPAHLSPGHLLFCQGYGAACCPQHSSNSPCSFPRLQTCLGLCSPTEHILGAPEVGSSAEKPSSRIPLMLHAVSRPRILRNQAQHPHTVAGHRHLSSAVYMPS